VIIEELITILIFLFISKETRFLPPRRHWSWLGFVVLIWMTAICSAYYSGNLGNKLNNLPTVPEGSNVQIVRLGLAVIPLYTVGVIVSIPICIIFMATLRRAFSYITNSKSNKKVIYATILLSALLFAIIALNLITLKTLKSKSDFRGYIFQITTPLTVYAYFMTIALILLLVHMVFWGVMQRPIYTLQRIGGERRKKLFAGIGFLLMGLAIPRAVEAAKIIGLDLIKSIFG